MSDDIELTMDQFFLGDIATAYPHDPEALESIKQSIAEHGQQDPIYVFPSGEIFDGAHRYQACVALGIPVRYQVHDVSREEAWDLAMAKNSDRRHLTKSQLACVLAKQVTTYGKRGGQIKATDLAAEVLAKKHGVHHSAISAAVVLLHEYPRDYRLVLEGRHPMGESPHNVLLKLRGTETVRARQHRKLRTHTVLKTLVAEKVNPEAGAKMDTEDGAKAVLEELISKAQANGTPTSVLYDDQGNIRLGWVKTQADKGVLADLLHAAVQGLKDEIPRDTVLHKGPASIGADSHHLLNQYTITDYHIGALAWGEETRGADWDTRIAEDTIVRWFQRAVQIAPAADTALFAQLGDFFHTDGLEPLTPANKNVLDVDSRRQLVIRVAMRILRRIVNLLLETHNNVHLLMAEGNHDPATSAALREFLAFHYEDNPRVTVDNSASPYYSHRHGNTLLLYHHGHMKGFQKDIDTVLARNFKSDFGEAEHVYAHMGHHHNDQIRETNLMKVEQHRTLAAADAYAHRGGWISGRDAKVITYDDRFGEVFRATINPAMLEDAIK